jgi:hypothetical protein
MIHYIHDGYTATVSRSSEQTAAVGIIFIPPGRPMIQHTTALHSFDYDATQTGDGSRQHERSRIALLSF